MTERERERRQGRGSVAGLIVVVHQEAEKREKREKEVRKLSHVLTSYTRSHTGSRKSVKPETGSSSS